ncbi:MAG: hypothetical protein JWP67_2413, partial [Mucilaginibacter sp.]|nr:hypothetical protein [Mucilaginibacter sp.]
NEIKAAMEGMLAPTFEEKIVANSRFVKPLKLPRLVQLPAVWY